MPKSAEIPPFAGFSRQAVDFLFENRLHDSRAWFEEHREEYNRLVLTPLRSLVVALTPTMLQIDPQFTVDPTVNKTIARIYRDVRFSKDKSLFRDSTWITFMRNKRFWAGLPGYYFWLGQNGFSYGFGYYEASTESMRLMREMILKNDRAFRPAFRAMENQSRFAVGGPRYKRSKYPGQPPELRQWLDVKSISFDCESHDETLLFSPALADALREGFLQLKPVYDFILAVEARRTRENND
jgi:uncharacterized protein (TIGR02453 family)